MKNLFSYDGKRVVISGCFSGMGEATARLVGQLGADVVAVDVKKPSITHAQFLEVDCRDAGAIDEAVASIAAGGPIDALLYCAGLPGGSFSNVDVMSVNFLGLRHMAERCATHMERGLLALDDHAQALAWVEQAASEPGFEGYSFSKMCTIAWTRHRGPVLTTETGVRLNCISPGPTDTPMMPHFEQQMGKDFMDRFPKPIGRNSTPEEQAWPMAFLCSPAASYISGENIFTDGGCAGGIMTGSIDPSAMFASS